MTRLFERRKDITRDAICEAAISVLVKHGLHGATMDRIAACAGVGKGSLYNYFSGKDDLLASVYDRTVQPFRDANGRIAASNMAADAKLEALIRGWGSFVEEYRTRLQVFAEGAQHEEILAAAIRHDDQRTIELIEDVINSGIDSGQFRYVNALCIAETLLMAAKGMLAAEIAERKRLTHEEIIATLTSVFACGLAATSTATRPANKDDKSSHLTRDMPHPGRAGSGQDTASGRDRSPSKRMSSQRDCVQISSRE